MSVKPASAQSLAGFGLQGPISQLHVATALKRPALHRARCRSDADAQCVNRLRNRERSLLSPGHCAPPCRCACLPGLPSLRQRSNGRYRLPRRHYPTTASPRWDPSLRRGNSFGFRSIPAPYVRPRRAPTQCAERRDWKMVESYVYSFSISPGVFVHQDSPVLVHKSLHLIRGNLACNHQYPALFGRLPPH